MNSPVKSFQLSRRQFARSSLRADLFKLPRGAARLACLGHAHVAFRHLQKFYKVA
jgi:hypothetical protein